MDAIEINDSGIAVANRGKVVLESPGYALVDENKLALGMDAYKAAYLRPRQINNRFWDNLSVDPLPVSNDTAKTHADLVSVHLRHILQSATESELIVTVPGSLRKEQLGLLLGIGQQQQLPIRGIVDSAVCSTMDCVTGKPLVHLDIHLHGCVVSRLEGKETRQRAAVETVSELGLVMLREKWAHVIADEFIRLTRFDPLYRAESEQTLYDRLSDWMAMLQNEKTLELEMRGADRDFRIGLAKKNWVEVVIEHYRRIGLRIEHLLEGVESPLLVVTHRMELLPGFTDYLKDEFPKAELIALSEGAAALGALDYSDQIRQDEEAIFFTTRLDSVSHKQISRPFDIQPTHLVHRGYAYPLGDVPLDVVIQGGDLTVISSQETSSPACRLALQGKRMTLRPVACEDLQVNGGVVTETTTLKAGDIIGLNGEELALITVVDQPFIG